MEVKILVICSVLLATCQVCTSNEENENHDEFYFEHAENSVGKHEEPKIKQPDTFNKNYQDKIQPNPKSKSIPQTSKKNSNVEATNAVSNLQQEIQIMNAKNKELKRKLKAATVIAPLVQQNNKMNRNVQANDKVKSKEPNLEVNTNNISGKLKTHLDEGDRNYNNDIKNNGVGKLDDHDEVPKKNQQGTLENTNKKLGEKKATTSQDDAKTVEKDKKTTTSTKEKNNPNFKTQTSQISPNSMLPKNLNENIVPKNAAPNGTIEDGNEYFEIENIVSEMNPTDEVEKLDEDSDVKKNLTIIEIPTGTVKSIEGKNSNQNQIKSINKSNQPKVISNKNSGKKTGTKVVDLDNNLDNDIGFRKTKPGGGSKTSSKPLNILPKEQMDQTDVQQLNDIMNNLVLHNDDVQEVIERPNFQGDQINMNQFNQGNDIQNGNYGPQYGQYYNTNYDSADQTFKWQAPQSTSYQLPCYYNPQIQYSYGSYPNTNSYNYGQNSNNQQSYKPDYTYVSPPFKNIYDKKLQDVIGRQDYTIFTSNNRNINVNDNMQNWCANSWPQTYQSQPNKYYGNLNAPFAKTFDYNEIIIPHKNLDRIWRHWRKTEIVLSGIKDRLKFNQRFEKVDRKCS